MTGPTFAFVTGMRILAVAIAIIATLSSGCTIVFGTLGAIKDSNERKSRPAAVQASAPGEAPPPAPASEDEEDDGMSSFGKGVIAGLLADAIVVGVSVFLLSGIDFEYGGE